jgi:hypothetical protein
MVPRLHKSPGVAVPGIVTVQHDHLHALLFANPAPLGEYAARQRHQLVTALGK